MDTKKEFTLIDGLNTQMKQLLSWKKKLNAECYDSLLGYAAKENERLSPNASGYDVVRGTDLDRHIGNWKPSKVEVKTMHHIVYQHISDMQQAIYDFSNNDEMPLA